MTGSEVVTQRSERQAIGIDIGGTKIAAAVVNESGKVLDKTRAATPPRTAPPSEVERVVSELVAKLQCLHPEVEAVGAGAAGLVEWPSGRIKWAPNSPHEGLHLKAVLERVSKLPAVVDNDANMAAWAEARLGQGKSSSEDLVLLTLGTGIGSGVVLSGQLYRGPTGMGAELGHITVDPRGPTCSCGNKGCLEVFSSGRALERIARQASHDSADSTLARFAKNPEDLTGKDVWNAATEGDPVARGIFAEMGFWLGVGIANIANILELETVAIGGGLAEVGELLLSPIRTSLADHYFAPQYRAIPAVVASKFGNDAGLIGAAHMALQTSAHRG